MDTRMRAMNVKCGIQHVRKLISRYGAFVSNLIDSPKRLVMVGKTCIADIRIVHHHLRLKKRITT